MRLAAVTVMVMLAARDAAGAQDSAAAATGRRALGLTFRGTRTSSWGLRTAPGATSGIWADVPRTSAVGARLAFTPRGRVEGFVAADLTVYGDLSGFTEVVAGAAYRVPLGRRLACAPAVGLGRLAHSSGVAFWNLAWGAELRWILSPGFAALAGFERLEPLGEAKGSGGTASEVEGTPSRLSIGVSWPLGKRIPPR